MASRLIQALFRTDPTEGFVQYVNTVKPYHTKVLEVLVEYVWTEQVNVTVCDAIHWDMVFSRPDTPTVYDCGYGIIWDAPGGFTHTAFMIKGVVTGLGGSWTIAGDHSSVIAPGQTIVVGRNIGGASGWYTVSSVTVLSGNTIVGVVETIVSTATPHGIMYVFDTSSETILNSTNLVNAFLVQGNQLEKFLEGGFIRVSNSYLARNNGAYIIHAARNFWYIDGVTTGLGGRFRIDGNLQFAFPVGSTFTVTGNTGGGNGTYTIASTALTTLNGSDPVTDIIVTGTVPIGTTADGQVNIPNTAIFVKEPVPASKPTSQTYDGLMALHQEGYDDPPYCRLARASDLHTDTFIGERLTFEFTLGSFVDNISAAVSEDEPRGYGVETYGGSPFGVGDAPHPSTAPTTGITILPTGVDGLYFDMGGFDENLSTVVNFYGRTIS